MSKDFDSGSTTTRSSKDRIGYAAARYADLTREETDVTQAEADAAVAAAEGSGMHAAAASRAPERRHTSVT